MITEPSALSRRQFLAATAGVAAAVGLLGGSIAAAQETAAPAPAAKRKGRLKQGVCRGVFRGVKLTDEEQCREAAKAGAYGIDLVGPEFFPLLKKYGLIPTMVPGGSAIKAGINDPKLHGEIRTRMLAAIKAAAEAGAPNVIVLAGDRAGFTDEQSMDNCVLFLNEMKKPAEDAGVTLCTELLNSKVNHPGYVCDHTAWGVELCKRVNSPRVKLLYDIYHMQIMEGDVIRTIQQNIKYLGHFHTAGNPGRHEFDDTQEMNYAGICRGIAATGYEGYISHEYTPTKDPLGTLDRMMRICEV
jgi:hydroxypyruvate isomerase